MSQNKHGNKPLSKTQKRMSRPEKQEKIFRGRAKLDAFFNRFNINL